MWHLGMNSNMNFPAPLAAMGFLAACAGVLLSVCALLGAAFVGKRKIAQLTLSLAGCGALAYFGLLLVFSLASHDRLLSVGQEKYFCEIDCHLAYSVLDARQEATGANNRYTLILKTRFDETTISSRRPKDAPLAPSPRTVELLDASGRGYLPSAVAGTALTTSLIPGASYTTELTFYVPSEAQDLKLLITTTPEWPDRVVIGDENSWLHKKTYFAL